MTGTRKRIGAAAALIALAAAALASVSAVAAGGTSRPRCQPRGKVVAASAVAILWRRGSADAHRTYVCVWHTGRTRSLGSYDSVAFGTYSFRLAGRYLAYDDLLCDHATCDGVILVEDLARGRIVRRIAAPADGGLVAGLVLRPSGSLGWSRFVANGAEIRTYDASGEHTLDSIPEADASSLALAHSTLYWTHDGNARSAPLH
jgi:hypothetical protein